MMGSKLFHLVGVSRPNEPAAAALPRVRIAPALPDRKTLDGEIARLRDLDVGGLRSRWHNLFGRRPHPHLPRHLLFRVLAYRLQADVLGDLDGESQRLLDRSVSPEDAGQRAADLARRTADLRPGTVLGREWNCLDQKVDQQRLILGASAIVYCLLSDVYLPWSITHVHRSAGA